MYMCTYMYMYIYMYMYMFMYMYMHMYMYMCTCTCACTPRGMPRTAYRGLAAVRTAVPLLIDDGAVLCDMFCQKVLDYDRLCWRASAYVA